MHDFLEETFEKVQGIYLDRGTSLYETLASLSAEEASRPVTETGTSIAAQVEHVRFYLRVIQDYIQDKQQGKIEWRTSWRKNEITPEDWARLLTDLHAEHDRLVALTKSIKDWSLERNLGGIQAAIVHTAYHLGSIRQILHVAKH